MKHFILLLGTALLLCTPNPAPAAQGPQFGCDARAPNVCRFRLFYAAGGDRIIVLPAGMKVNVTEAVAGKDQYCIAANVNPVYRCVRRAVKSTYNN
jgi:hypothetical protein